MTGSRPASPLTGETSVADFLDVEEIEAAGAARIMEDGIVAVAIVAGQWGYRREEGRVAYLAAPWARLI